MTDSTKRQLNVEIRDIREARHFYCEELGCTELPTGGSSFQFTLDGNQIECHLSTQLNAAGTVTRHYRLSGRTYLAVPHFSVELTEQDWNAFLKRLKRRRIAYTFNESLDPEAPRLGEASFCLIDPSGNLIEVRAASIDQEPSRRRLKRLGGWISGVILMAALGWWLWQVNASRLSAEDPAPPPARRASCRSWAFCAQ